MWKTLGGGGGDLSDAVPLVEAGAGAPGAGEEASRWNHVHPAAGGGGDITLITVGIGDSPRSVVVADWNGQALLEIQVDMTGGDVILNFPNPNLLNDGGGTVLKCYIKYLALDGGNTLTLQPLAPGTWDFEGPVDDVVMIRPGEELTIGSTGTEYTVS